MTSVDSKNRTRLSSPNNEIITSSVFFQVAYPLEKENKEVRGWIQLLVIAQCYEENNETIRLGDIILFYCPPKAQSNIILYF